MVDNIIQSLINGVMLGAIYALIALGLSIVFGVMNIINFAHGDFVMLAMYATFWISTTVAWDPIATPLITVPLLFLAGILAYFLLIDRTLRERAVTQIAVTVGLMVFLRAITQMLFEARPRAVSYSIIQGSIALGPYTITLTRFVSALIALIAILAVYLFLTRTWARRAIRAASDDLDAASLVGANPKRIYALALGLGSALTAVAGALLIDEMYSRLQKLKSLGLTVLLVEQDTAHALELADRGYVLENGEVVLEGRGADLANSEHIQKHYLGL